MTEREECLEAISEAIETLLDSPKVKRLDGDGWKAYRVGTQIRVDVDDFNKEDQRG